MGDVSDVLETALESTPAESERYELIRELMGITSLPQKRTYYVDDAGSFLYFCGDIYENLTNMATDELRYLVADAKTQRSRLTYKTGDLPRVYITTEEGSVTDEYTGAAVAVVSGSGETQRVFEDDNALIKIRGNSTSVAPKKPYNIRFGESVSLLGMDKGKRWVLLANAFDKTQLRNKLALDLAARIGISYTSQSEYVDVWVDGVDCGLYLLCEPVTDGKHRVNIDTEKGDFLLELSLTRRESGYNFIETSLGVPLNISKPESMTESLYELLAERLDEIEAAISTHDMDIYGDYIDVDSFIDFYLFMEYVKDVDGYFASTYFYIKNGKLYAGPPWDFDLSMGNVNPKVAEIKYYAYCNIMHFGDNSHDSTHGVWMREGWFAALWEDDDFKAAAERRWHELLPIIENLYEDNVLGENRIDCLVKAYGDAIAADYDEIGWDLYAEYSPYENPDDYPLDEHYEILRGWLKKRAVWLTEELFK